MPENRMAVAERIRQINSASIEGTIDRVLSEASDPIERILYAFVCRYAGSVTTRDFSAAADAMEWALSALRDAGTGRDSGEAEAMRETAALACIGVFHQSAKTLAESGEIGDGAVIRLCALAEGATTCAAAIRALPLQTGSDGHE